MTDVPLPLPLYIKIEEATTVEVRFWAEPQLRRNRTVWLPLLEFLYEGKKIKMDYGRPRRSRQAAINWLWERREDMYCADYRTNKKDS
jgi:hypothetical protein